MEYRHWLLLVTAVLAVVAFYIVFTTETAQPSADSSAANALLIKSAGFGRGLKDYVFSYTELADGYKTTYVLIRSGNSSLVEIQNPLSMKRVYLLPNDTILCIKYPINETCSRITNNPELQNYINFVKSKFFNDTLIDRAVDNMEELIRKGYLITKPQIENVTSGLNPCSRVNYIIDYSNITVEEAARYGIGPQSPKLYRLSRCIEPQSGLPYETTLDYNDKGLNHTKVTRVILFRNVTAPIEAPTTSNGNAVEIFEKEREQQVKLATCHTDKSGEEREKCVADIALNLRRKDICELAGARRDRCLVAIVPLTKDQTICMAVANASFRDDCYIELAGAYKDIVYCNKVVNTSKLEFCERIAGLNQQQRNNETNVPSPKANSSTSNTTSKSSGSSVDIESFLNYIDKYDKNQTYNVNESGSANQSG